jgi:hypothetical protein
VINPKTYEAEVGDCIGKTQGDGIAIPIMVTGLGDLITWEPSVGVIAIIYRAQRTVGLGRKVSTFLRLTKVGGAKQLAMDFDWGIFPDAVAAHGALSYDESFIFVPLLSLGGQAKVENLQKRDTITSIRVAVDLQGIIGH